MNDTKALADRLKRARQLYEALGYVDWENQPNRIQGLYLGAVDKIFTLKEANDEHEAYRVASPVIDRDDEPCARMDDILQHPYVCQHWRAYDNDATCEHVCHESYRRANGGKGYAGCIACVVEYRKAKGLDKARASSGEPEQGAALTDGDACPFGTPWPRHDGTCACELSPPPSVRTPEPSSAPAISDEVADRIHRRVSPIPADAVSFVTPTQAAMREQVMPLMRDLARQYVAAAIAEGVVVPARSDSGEADERDALRDAWESFMRAYVAEPVGGRRLFTEETFAAGWNAALARLREVGRDAEWDQALALLAAVGEGEARASRVRGDVKPIIEKATKMVRAALRASGARGQEETKT